MKMIKQSQESIDAIIFDVTGTTINMYGSQVYAIELTVNNYFKKTVVTQDGLRRSRRIAGYNNEWDTTYALVRMLEAEVPADEWVIEAQKLLPIDRSDALFRKVYAIFQTCYLGSELFMELENGVPPFPYSPGLITLERSFISKDLIRALKRKGYKLGIATGCPRAEALISLGNQGLMGKGLFEERYLVGLEDTLLSKPDPAPLLEAKRRLGAKNPVYVGDNASDVEAARRAGMPCLYVGDQDPEAEDSVINRLIRTLL